MKSENGDLYDKSSFDVLMKIINKRNHIELFKNVNTANGLTIFKKLLEKEVLKEKDLFNLKELFR